jgi:transcriptional regulator with XRE-family HTH domain
VKQLRAWRMRRFLTQKELAARVGVPYQTVQRWESGQRFPRPGHLRRLCEALEVTPDELLTLDELEGKDRAA